MEKFLLLLLGPSWRTSLIALTASGLLELGVGLDAVPFSTWKGWHVVALVLIALGRAMKDSVATGGSAPATREAASRIAKTLMLALAIFGAVPVFAEDPPADPTAANSDPGAVLADATAQAAPDFRLGAVLAFLPGKPALVPAVAITPLAISLRDGSVTTGVTVGAGYELLWNASAPTARGVAVYANMRSTADGPKPLVSVLGVFTPYVGLGLGYQIGGGATPFRDAAVVLASFGTNLGVSPPR